MKMGSGKRVELVLPLFCSVAEGGRAAGPRGTRRGIRRTGRRRRRSSSSSSRAERHQKRGNAKKGRWFEL